MRYPKLIFNHKTNVQCLIHQNRAKYCYWPFYITSCFLGIYGFHNNKKLPFLKITVALPRLIAPAKRLLEQGFTCPGYSAHGFQAYESNIDFEIRYGLRNFWLKRVLIIRLILITKFNFISRPSILN